MAEHTEYHEEYNEAQHFNKEFAEFKIEVLTQLAVINEKLDGYNKLKDKVDEAEKRSRQNEKEISALKDNNKWLIRTAGAAVITAAIGVIVLLAEMGMGVK